MCILELLNILAYSKMKDDTAQLWESEKSWEKKVAINLEQRWKFIWLYIYKDVLYYSGWKQKCLKTSPQGSQADLCWVCAL